MKWEEEFFRLAGFMLLSRYQVVNGEACTEHIGHSRDTSSLLFHQLSYVGYKDAIGEMKLLLMEVAKNGRPQKDTL
jgi:hypothetical protein